MPGGGTGATGNAPAATPYTLGPDDYVTVVVPIHKFDVINSGGTYGTGPDGKPERLAKPGRFHFETKFGITFIDANQNDIILDYKGLDPVKKVDLFPDTKKLLQLHRNDTKNYGSPEGHIQLAEWCLEVGMPDEAMTILDKLNEHPNKESFKPTTATAVQTYQKVKDLLTANIDKSEKANQWKDRLGYQALSVSKHYAIVHQENTQESANRRLDALEMNFKTVYTWFAIRGRALPAPSEKLVAVIVGDASEFRRYRDTFEASNLVADGFHARRENLAVFSGRRLDKASVNFEQLVRDVYRVMKPEDLFKGKLPNRKEQPNAPENYTDYARASTLALVDKALQQEAEIAAATHEGTKQLFAETGLLPRNVLAPEWVRFGIAALFEMPKGPFPGGGSQLKVALHPGGGGPNWAYMRYYEEMREKNLINDRNAADLFIETVIDMHFRTAHKVEMLGRLTRKGTEEGDSKATPAEELYARARTLGWSVVYFMAKTKFSEFERFLQELGKLPRDAELDADAVITSFCIANGISTAGLNGTNPDISRFMGIGLLWKQFMDGQTSPTRAMKIDTLVTKPDDGSTGTGRPGTPGGSGPGGRPGGPGGPPGAGGPGGPGGGLPSPGRPGG